MSQTNTTSNTALLQAQGVKKVVQATNGALLILHEVTLAIEAGQSIAIVGPSGSGKSTLLALLAGLDLPTAGSIHCAGALISAMDEDQRAAWRARSVGFVFQQFHLLPALTALENIMLPLELGNTAINARQAALDLLQRVGLAERAQHYPRQLSGGEQQRVALARACVHQPQLLFADEPTGSLDENTGNDIANMLFAMNQELGTTLILVTHDLALAARCQRIVKIHHGQIFSEQNNHVANYAPAIAEHTP